MNEATALPPTTEGVRAEANSHKTMLEVALVASIRLWTTPISGPRNRHPERHTSQGDAQTQGQWMRMSIRLSQEAPFQTDHATTATEPSTAAVTATQTR